MVYCLFPLLKNKSRSMKKENLHAENLVTAALDAALHYRTVLTPQKLMQHTRKVYF